MNFADRQVLDGLSHELDLIEKVSPMVHNYARVTPAILEHEQSGVKFRFIIYHRESVAWFGNSDVEWSLRAISESGLLRADDVVFDLGCNSGFHTTWYAASAPRGHVYAFDPFPWNIAATRAQAKLNSLTNVTAFPVGIGHRDRRIVTDLTGSKTFNPDVVSGGDGSVELRVVRPNQFLRHKPTFLKIDIEGAEQELTRTKLAKFRTVQRGVVEMHPEFISRVQGQDPAAFLDHLIAHRYVVSHQPNGPAIQRFGEVKAGSYYFQRPPQPRSHWPFR